MLAKKKPLLWIEYQTIFHIGSVFLYECSIHTVVGLISHYITGITISIENYDMYRIKGPFHSVFSVFAFCYKKSLDLFSSLFWDHCAKLNIGEKRFESSQLYAEIQSTFRRWNIWIKRNEKRVESYVTNRPFTV